MHVNSLLVAIYHGPPLASEAYLRVEEEAIVTAAGLAPRAGAAMSAASPSTMLDEATTKARREHMMARTMEYGGCTHLSFNAYDNMWITRKKARIAWRANSFQSEERQIC